MFTEETDKALREVIFEAQRAWEKQNGKKLQKKAVHANIAVIALSKYILSTLASNGNAAEEVKDEVKNDEV